MDDDDDCSNNDIETIHVVVGTTPKQPLNKNEDESGRREIEKRICNLLFNCVQSDTDSDG